jgi:hypothetical protein
VKFGPDVWDMRLYEGQVRPLDLPLYPWDDRSDGTVPYFCGRIPDPGVSRFDTFDVNRVVDEVVLSLID